MENLYNYCYYLLIFLLLFTTFSCSKQKEVKDILVQAENIVKQQPDSALALLLQIEDSYRLEKEEKADYWRILSKAHSLTNKAMIMDSLILYSLHFYQNAQDTVKLLETYSLAGEYYRWKSQPDSAVNLYGKGLALAQNLKDTARIARFLHYIGMMELGRSRNKEAVAYFKREIHFDPNAHFAYYLAGLFSPELINDSTQYYIDEGVKLALQQRDTLYAAHYLRNYAGSLTVKKDYDKAIRLIKRTGELTDFYKDFWANDIIMAQIYINKGQLDSAQFYLNKAEKVEKKSSLGTYTDHNLVSDRNASYAFQAVIDAKRNRDVEPDLTAMFRFNDSIIAVTIDKDRILTEQTVARSNLEQRNLKLLVSKQRFQVMLITGLFVIILAAIALYFYYLKRKSKLKEMEERVESLQRLYREALKVKDEKFNNNQLFRSVLLQQLGIIRFIATATSTSQNKQLLSRIIDISNEAVSTESLLKWNDLYAIIDSVYDNFYTKLIRKYGNVLIEKEIQLCCLLCANFSTAEISTVMQQSMQTIYQRKSTVRGKINMGDKEDIISYLEEQL